MGWPESCANATDAANGDEKTAARAALARRWFLRFMGAIVQKNRKKAYETLSLGAKNIGGQAQIFDQHAQFVRRADVQFEEDGRAVGVHCARVNGRLAIV